MYRRGGAAPELIALMAPLLRGWERGGTTEMQQAADRFLLLD